MGPKQMPKYGILIRHKFLSHMEDEDDIGRNKSAYIKGCCNWDQNSHQKRNVKKAIKEEWAPTATKRMIIQFLLLNGFLQISAAPSPPSSPSSFSSNIGADDGKGGFFCDFFKKLEDAFKDIFKPSGRVESRSLEQIYQAALKEGNGTMVVYSGGTARGQQAGTKRAFERRFPGLRVEIVVDYSTNQGPRIDVQLENNSLVPDVVQLQTLQDFPRWKEQGHLLQYKPANWSKVHESFRDPDGYYTANLVLLLGTVVNSAQVAKGDWPKTAKDFLKPEFKGGKLAIVHPNMDDFVLFYFKQLVDKYGYEYLAQFAAQQPTYFCEGFAQLMAMGFAGGNATALVAPAGIGSIAYANSSIPQFSFPADNDPFATYVMYAAIFKQAKRPETAKLYVNWLLEQESPNNQGNIWSVRTDMTPRQGFRPVWEYTNSNHAAFLAFMEDYEERERFSRQIDLFFGAAKCDTSPLEPSLNPTSQ